MSDSSSTTSTLPLVGNVVGWGTVISGGTPRLPGGVGRGQRKLDAERGAATVPVGDFDRSAMLLHDTVRHRQTQSGALARRLGSEEGVVDAVYVFGRYSGSRIGHFH